MPLMLRCGPPAFASLIALVCCSAAPAASLEHQTQSRATDLPSGPQKHMTTETGYRGIWYANQPQKDQYRYKYSGGLGTYPQQHLPLAIYCKPADKTFFCYGGTDETGSQLLDMVAFFDHATGRLSRPVVVCRRSTIDAHYNPTLGLDEKGHIYVFCNSHGTGYEMRPDAPDHGKAYILRSDKPFSIDSFTTVHTTNFSYSQPWWIEGRGFLWLHTRYSGNRRFLHWAVSPDGLKWSEPQRLAAVHNGHYQISWRRGTLVATAFDLHPPQGGLNQRTNIYFLQTDDMGRTWRTVDGKEVSPPLTTEQAAAPALVHDYRSQKLLVYLKDLTFDAAGRPVILYLTSRGHESGPANDPRIWYTARWTGSKWDLREVTRSDHNYDHGSLYIEPDGSWNVIAPTDPGPQAYGTGGEIVWWRSTDEGTTWKRHLTLTSGSRYNHTYVRRPVDAHAGFYALWADGDAFGKSLSSLYFCDSKGQVFRMPHSVKDDAPAPQRLP